MAERGCMGLWEPFRACRETALIEHEIQLAGEGAAPHTHPAILAGSQGKVKPSDYDCAIYQHTPEMGL